MCGRFDSSLRSHSSQSGCIWAAAGSPGESSPSPPLPSYSSWRVQGCIGVEAGFGRDTLEDWSAGCTKWPRALNILCVPLDLFILPFSIHLSVCLSSSRFVLSMYLSVCLSVHVFIYLSIHLLISPCIYLSIYLSICVSGVVQYSLQEAFFSPLVRGPFACVCMCACVKFRVSRKPVSKPVSSKTADK